MVVTDAVGQSLDTSHSQTTIATAAGATVGGAGCSHATLQGSGEVIAGGSSPHAGDAQDLNAGGMVRTPSGLLGTAVAQTSGLVRVGRWGNALVRQDASLTQDHLVLSGEETATETHRERRERENRECLGGLRSPWRAIRRMTHAHATGRAVHDFFDAIFDHDKYWEGLVDQLGSAGKTQDQLEGIPRLSDKVESLRSKLLTFLGATSCRPSHPCTLWSAPLVHAWQVAANDPDSEFVNWLYEGCPLGAASPVMPRNLPSDDGRALSSRH